MALMTLEDFKAYLGITDTSQDAVFTLFEPVAESKLNSFLRYTLEALPLGYEPDYARLPAP